MQGCVVKFHNIVLSNSIVLVLRYYGIEGQES